MKVRSLGLFMATTLVLASCGGSSGGGNGTRNTTSEEVTFGSAITGQFVDAPVNGLNYYINGDTSTVSQTSGTGNFSCNVGDFVTFRLGDDLVIGTAACGTLVAPTYFGTEKAKKIAAIIQNIAGGTTGVLDVTSALGRTLGITSIDSVTDLTSLNAVLTAAGVSTVADYNAALTAAETAMNNYLASVSDIPEEYQNNTYTFEVTAALDSGNAQWCDAQSRFQAVVEVGTTSAEVKFYSFDDSGNVEPTPVIESMIYGTTFHVGNFITDEDETYFINGSASFSEQGFSGTFVETTTETAETAYLGEKCAYSFSNVEPEAGESKAE